MRSHAALALTLLLVAAAVVRTQPPDAEAAPRKPLEPATALSLRRILDMPIEIPEEFKQPVPLRLVLKHFGDRVNSEGKDFPVWIDQNAFRMEDENANDLLDINVTFPAFLRRMPISTGLRIALSHMPTPATYLIRHDGYIEVTTPQRATISFLLDEAISVTFRGTPVRQALEELSERSGVSIGVDAAMGETLKKPFDLVSYGDMSARGVLECLADSYDLRVMVDEHRVFVTTQENYAKRLKARLAEAETRKKLTELGESVPAPYGPRVQSRFRLGR